MSSPPDRLRAPAETDAEAIAGLFAGLRSIDAEEVLSWLRNPTFDVTNDFRVLERNGSLAGYADVHVNGDRLSVDWVAQDVPSSHALLDWATDRGRAQGASRVQASAGEPAGPSTDVLRERGFSPVRSSLEMRVDLTDAIPEPSWPEDVAVRTPSKGEERRVHSVIEEAFADTNDFTPMPYDEWAAWVLAPSRLDRDLWFTVLQEDEIAALMICQSERAGEPGLGWIETLAVLRAWRRRGLGTALLLHAFRLLRERGRAAAGLSVDAQNPTGAVRLYESVGMRRVRTRVVYEKRLGD